jgi:S1-C subfamily serine protease
MNLRITAVGSWLAFGIQAAIAQDVTTVSRDMELHGNPLNPKAADANSNASRVSLRGLDSVIPMSLLSKIAQTPVSEPMGSSRSAKDAQIYRSISPSVVLVVNKESLGSGSLLSSTGDVLTNYHVVKGYSTVAVVFKPTVEGAEPTRDDIKVGQVVKYDEITDLALIKVTEVPIGRNPIRLGSTEEISVGADVHAIGHPTGEAWTYTTGIISQYRMGYNWKSEGEEFKHKADIIQTQTPINPGNSGGPLVGDTGNLIGVNSFKAAGEALNFAVSVDEVKRFLLRSGNRNATTVSDEKKVDCAPKALTKFRDKVNSATITSYDMFCNGKASGEYVTPDKQADAVLLRVDRNGDGKADVIFFDLKRRGKWDISFWDEKFNGQWNLVGYHDDGTLKASRFESYSAYQKRLASNQ